MTGFRWAKKLTALVLMVAAGGAGFWGIQAWAQDTGSASPAAPAAVAATAPDGAAAPDTPASADAPAPEAPPAPLPAGQLAPLDRVKASPQGTLKNPYSDDNGDIVAQGQKLYLQYSCNGCHGGNGGGGICPPLINDTWVYGGDDDTLFRLVSLGSIDLQAKGYARKGHENVVAPMPAFGPLIRSDDELWKIFAFVRSHYNGSPSRKYGAPPEAAPEVDPNASNSADTPDPTVTSK